MNVLIDYHSGCLYNSLVMLFERRLGFHVYRPIGWDWYENGFWKVAEPYGNAKETIGQYLDINNDGYVPYKNLNGDNIPYNEVFYVKDHENNITHRAVTFDTFKQMQFDIIVSTHPLHDCWLGLQEYQPKAKMIGQIGNEGQKSLFKNILSSNWAYVPENQNVMYYHQEFDLNTFRYSNPENHSLIRSFVHLLPEKETFDIYKSSLPEYTFEYYGIGTENGPSNDLARQMKESAFGWHIKPADGYGHVIHNWFACGRPIITRGNYYLGKTGGLLLEDGVTCIDLDKHTFSDNVSLIKSLQNPEDHEDMCKEAYKRFTEVVNFDKEEQDIRSFLSNII